MSLATLVANDTEILTAQSALLDYTGHVRPELTTEQVTALVAKINRARYDNGWSPLNMEGRAPVPTDKADWMEIGVKVVTPARRAAFLAAVEGMAWRGAEGSHPMSPAMAIETVISEFGISPVEAVSYNVPWDLPDGPETATYTVIGIKTRIQRLIFTDGGCAVTPILILPA